ncbi:MAG: helix-turn-helix domain-containing protein, partial [Firmicutes bacterium]|nr:helix-turn-helix domain-containing protein [Bacillota bacterium]
MKTTVNRQNFKETAEIGETIRNLRKNSGLTQNALAEYLHISRQCVSKWECAKNLPDVQQIVQLSDFFGVTTDFLLKKFNPPPPSDKL